MNKLNRAMNSSWQELSEDRHYGIYLPHVTAASVYRVGDSWEESKATAYKRGELLFEERISAGSLEEAKRKTLLRLKDIIEKQRQLADNILNAIDSELEVRERYGGMILLPPDATCKSDAIALGSESYKTVAASDLDGDWVTDKTEMRQALDSVGLTYIDTSKLDGLVIDQSQTSSQSQRIQYIYGVPAGQGGDKYSPCHPLYFAAGCTHEGKEWRIKDD